MPLGKNQMILKNGDILHFEKESIMSKKSFGYVLTVLLLCFITGSLADAAFGNLRFDTNASTIDLGEEKVLDWAAFDVFLDGFPNLKHVDMFATPVKKKQIDHLVQCYPQIEFGWTIQFDEHTVRTDALAFSTLHTGGSKSHSTDTLSVLKYCKNLRALDIGHNSVDQLSFLSDLTELRVLIVACNRIEDISVIGKLKHLEYLEMFSNYVEDISPLTDLPYLAHLNIGYNNIKDLSPLYRMPQLKRLWMKKCHSRQKTAPISSDVISQLQEALDGCVIDTNSNPSEGGWRECVYFDIFHDYFRTGLYIPFPDSPQENR